MQQRPLMRVSVPQCGRMAQSNGNFPVKSKSRGDDVLCKVRTPMDGQKGYISYGSIIMSNMLHVEGTISCRGWFWMWVIGKLDYRMQ